MLEGIFTPKQVLCRVGRSAEIS